MIPDVISSDTNKCCSEINHIPTPRVCLDAERIYCRVVSGANYRAGEVQARRRSVPS